MIRLAIAGATGRTGSRVLELAAADERFDVVAALTSPGCSSSGSPVRLGEKQRTIAESLEVDCDVLIDFTVADGTMAWLPVCKERSMPMVTGVTGHSDEQFRVIRRVAQSIAIVKASNFSVGVHVLMRLVRCAADMLGDSYDIELVEAHHRHKVDAPSGTALRLVDEILAVTGRTAGDVVHGRCGRVGERAAGEIGVHAVRMGEIVGQHELHFSGPGETLTIRHTAHSRDTFAAGALRAASWIVGKPAGLYGFSDVMESSD